MTNEANQTPPAPTAAVRWLRNGAGVLLLFAGLGGLFLPILQTLLLIAAGLWLIDLPLKQRAHRALLAFGWYRRLSGGASDLLRRWREPPPGP
jgi:hypothetical protein